MMSIDVWERSVVRVEEDVERHVVVAAVVHRRWRDVGYVVERVQVVGQQVAAGAAPASDAAQAAQRPPVRREEAAVAERIVVGHEEGVVLEHPSERFDVVHGETERRDFRQLLAGRRAAARRASGRRRRRRLGRVRVVRRRDGPAQRLERLVDLLHAAPFASVGRLSPVLAQRRRLLLGLGRPLADHGLLEFLFHFDPASDGPRPQAVLFALHRPVSVIRQLSVIHWCAELVLWRLITRSWAQRACRLVRLASIGYWTESHLMRRNQIVLHWNWDGHSGFNSGTAHSSQRFSSVCVCVCIQRDVASNESGEQLALRLPRPPLYLCLAAAWCFTVSGVASFSCAERVSRQAPPGGRTERRSFRPFFVLVAFYMNFFLYFNSAPDSASHRSRRC